MFLFKDPWSTSLKKKQHQIAMLDKPWKQGGEGEVCNVGLLGNSDKKVRILKAQCSRVLQQGDWFLHNHDHRVSCCVQAKIHSYQTPKKSPSQSSLREQGLKNPVQPSPRHTTTKHCSALELHPLPTASYFLWLKFPHLQGCRSQWFCVTCEVWFGNTAIFS